MTWSVDWMGGRGYESVDLMLDDLYILRYRPVQGLLAADRIELV